MTKEESKLYTEEEVDILLNNILNDIFCLHKGKDALYPFPNSNKICVFVTGWFKQNGKK